MNTMLLGGGGGTPAITFTANSATITSCQTCNYGTLSIGTADSTRLVCAAVSTNGVNTAGETITSGTIAGVAVTVVKQASGATRGNAAIACAPVPTGTTGAISLTFSNTSNNSTIGVYSLTNLTSSTPTATSSSTTTAGGQTQDLTLTVQTGGVVIGASADNADSAFSSIAWTGATLSTGDYNTEGGTGWYSSAHATPPSGGSYSFKVAWTTSSRGAGVAATFR